MSRCAFVFVDQAAKDVAAVELAGGQPALPCHCALIARAPQAEVAVGTVAVAGSVRGAVPAFRRARFPGPPSEPGVPVIPAPGSPPGPSPNRRLRCRSAPQYPACTTRSDAGIHRRLLPCRHAPPPRCALRHVHTSGVLGLLRALRHDPPPTADDVPARHPKAGRAATGRFPRSPPPGRRGRCPALPGSLTRGTPQPFPLASPTGHYLPATESPAASAVGVHC